MKSTFELIDKFIDIFFCSTIFYAINCTAATIIIWWLKKSLHLLHFLALSKCNICIYLRLDYSRHKMVLNIQNQNHVQTFWTGKKDVKKLCRGINHEDQNFSEKLFRLYVKNYVFGSCSTFHTEFFCVNGFEIKRNSFLPSC